MKTGIKHKLPDKCSIVFDGWSEGTVHYIGVCASYMTVVESSEVVAHTLAVVDATVAN